MAANYNKLWKLLIDKGMTKTDLRMKTGMSTSTLAKMSKNEKNENIEFPNQKIIGVEMENEVKSSFIAYSMSVIMSRV